MSNKRNYRLKEQEIEFLSRLADQGAAMILTDSPHYCAVRIGSELTKMKLRDLVILSYRSQEDRMIGWMTSIFPTPIVNDEIRKAVQKVAPIVLNFALTKRDPEPEKAILRKRVEELRGAPIYTTDDARQAVLAQALKEGRINEEEYNQIIEEGKDLGDFIRRDTEEG